MVFHLLEHGILPPRLLINLDQMIGYAAFIGCKLDLKSIRPFAGKPQITHPENNTNSVNCEATYNYQAWMHKQIYLSNKNCIMMLKKFHGQTT